MHRARLAAQMIVGTYKAHPQLSPICERGTAVERVMTVWTLDQAMSSANTKARCEPENQCARSLFC